MRGRGEEWGRRFSGGEGVRLWRILHGKDAREILVAAQHLNFSAMVC